MCASYGHSIFVLMLLFIRYRCTVKRAAPLPTIQTWIVVKIIPLDSILSPITRHLFVKSFSIRDVYHSNVKIGVLSREGKIEAARKLFDKMPTKDVVTWNSMVTGYWKSGLLLESKRLFEVMPLKNVVSWNSMIAGCVENEMVDEAFNYFLAMPEKNTASYNAMISGFVKFDRMQEAYKLFQEMPSRNVISYTTMIDGYARNGEMERARALFDAMPCKNAVSWTVMISGLVQNGFFVEARNLLDQMPDKNIFAMTAMLTGYCKEGMMNEARILFEEIPCRDLVSWNVMITGYAQNGCGEEALRLFSHMVKTGTQPDELTFVSIFIGCSSLALLEEGRQTHSFIIKHGFESSLSVYNALISLYSKCGGILDSELAFAQIPHPDLVSWNTIIAASAQHGLYDKAVTYFEQMVTVGVQPDGITFLSLLSACGHAGKVDECMHFFNLMVHNYGVPPRSEHYACMVDIMSRAGQLHKACKLIEMMPFGAESSIWGALLSSCSIHLNVELGELAARRILELDPNSSGAYVMLSNLYAAAGKWKEVNRVRITMREQGVQKQKAYSWMQIGNNIHHFLGGDASHPNIGNIHNELRRITLHMKVMGDAEEIFFLEAVI